VRLDPITLKLEPDGDENRKMRSLLVKVAGVDSVTFLKKVS
jgi:hypothetical protein